MCASHKKNEGYGTERSVNEKSKDGPTEMEIQEWNMELRTNNVLMDEHSFDVRMEKIKYWEKCESQRRQDRNRISEERDRMNEKRERTNIAREHANDKRETEYTARDQEHEERDNANKLRELSIVEREGINKCREVEIDKREWWVWWVW